MTQRNNTPIHKTIRLYTKSGWKSFFAKMRFWYAPFRDVEKLLPKNGTITDLGCGEGIFTNYLGLSGSKRRVIGIELDEKRLSIADKNLPNVKFVHGNIATIKLPKSDAIISIHVLHHLHSYDQQIKVVKQCVKTLNKNGTLIIVEINVTNSLRYFLTWFTDHFLVAWFFEKRIYTPIFFREANEWKKLFEESGLTCRIQIPNQTLKPFSNIIFICQKK